MAKPHPRHNHICGRRHASRDKFGECSLRQKSAGRNSRSVWNDKLDQSCAGRARAETGNDGSVNVMPGTADNSDCSDGAFMSRYWSWGKGRFYFGWKIHTPTLYQICIIIWKN